MILLRLGLRNLRLHWVKSLIVGFMLFFGAILVVAGGGVLDAIDDGMANSLIYSVTGHAQLYDRAAEDELQVFGDFTGAMGEIGQITDFPRVQEVLEKVDNVRTLVPMGIDSAVTVTGNILDRKLAALRAAVGEPATAAQKSKVADLLDHVRTIVAQLDRELGRSSEIIDVETFKKQYGDSEPDRARTRDPKFWERFDADPLETLEFLENKIAPLAFAEDMIWVRYIGTDTELFKDTFDRFEIVDGEPIPAGKRGFLFNKTTYEEFVKNKTARRLDQIKEKVDDGTKLAECDDCQTWMKMNASQAANLAYQLDRTATAVVREAVQKSTGSTESDIVELLRGFFAMDDTNFAARYQLFYDVIAPRIILYSVAVGDDIVLNAFSRGGYVRKVPMRVYGTFRFKSLDKSPLAGGFNLMDIMSFRDLYGYMTEERKAAQEAIRDRAGVEDITRDAAEDALFGGGGDDEAEADAARPIDLDKLDLGAGGERYTEESYQRVYTKDELYSGVVVNVAVVFDDGDRAEATMKDIEAAIQANDLPVQVVGWRKSSGIIGQFVGFIRGGLYLAVFIIFLVALVVINNTMLMSTMERTREIGTMRAIGAQRRFILEMFVFETGVLAVLFGGAGAALGAGLLIWLGQVGIPASGDITYFLFSGPRLYPTLAGLDVVAALAVIAVVALLSTLYPAMIAMRVTPREAMQARE